MKSQTTKLIHPATPRAAAVAGILFSIFLAISLLLIHLSVPADFTTVFTKKESNG